MSRVNMLKHVIKTRRNEGTLTVHSIVQLMRLFCFWVMNLRTVPHFKQRSDLLKFSVDACTSEGVFMEFGVAGGRSINIIARLVPDKKIYGFDSFEGLPEDLGIGRPKGTFVQDRIPDVEDNVVLVVGWFQDTLNQFLEEFRCNVSFIHMDADLYSSTKYVLDTLIKHNKIAKGLIIQFDEFFTTQRGLQCEYDAFIEVVNQHQLKFEYIGYSFNIVAVRILGAD